MKKLDFDVLAAKRALLDESMPAEEWVKTYALGLLTDDITLRTELSSQTIALNSAGKFGQGVRLALAPVVAKAPDRRSRAELNGFVDACVSHLSTFLAEVTAVVTESRKRLAKNQEIDAMLAFMKDTEELAKAGKYGPN